MAEEFESRNEINLAQQAWSMEVVYKTFYIHAYDDVSINYINQYIAEARKKGWKVQESECILRKGLLYYKQNKYGQAFEFIQKGYQKLKELGYQSSPGIIPLLEEVGRCYYEFGDYEGAIHFLREAVMIDEPFIREGDKHVVKNTLALAFQKLEQFDSAIYYLKSAHVDALTAQNFFWAGLTSGNLGYVYYLQGKYNEAIPLMETDYKESIKADQWPSAVNAALVLATMMLREGREKEAATYLEYSESNRNYWNIRDMAGFYKNMAIISRIKGEYLQALTYMDSTQLYVDSIRRINDTQILNKSKLQVEVENHASEIKLLKAMRSRQVLLRNALLATLILSGLIGVLWINRLRLERRKEMEVLSIRQAFAEDELRSAQRELETFTKMVKEKNDLIESFRTEIDQLHYSDIAHREQRTGHLTQLLNSTILTEDDWKEFRILFDKVYPGFFIHLRDKVPDLSPADTRLLALTKLQLAPKEMAAMLGITYEAIKKSRQRLRKKINLPEEGSLEEVVEMI